MSARGVARVTATTVLALAVSSAAVAATEARELWVRRYSASNADSARAIGVSPDGAKLFVTGQANGLVTIAYDASGKRLWLARDQGAGEALAVSPDGSTVYVTGTSRASGYETVAYDAATGARLWAQREPASGGCCPSSAAAVGVSPDGSRVFVTGWLVVNAASGFDCVTIAYDAATGARLWTTRYNGPANLDDAAVALAVSADGSKLLVTGGVDGAQMYRVYSADGTVAYDASTGDELWSTLAYDAATGSTVWVRRYDGPAHGSDGANALGVSADGSEVFVTGGSQGMTRGSAYATVAYDGSSGAQLWVARYDGSPDRDGPAALGVSPDGSQVFVTGMSGGSPTFRYD